MCCGVLAIGANAQRGGGGHGSGFGGGHGGFGGGARGFGGGMNRGFGGGFNRGFGIGINRGFNGFNHGFNGFNRGFHRDFDRDDRFRGWGWGWGWPVWGWGWSWPYWGYSYDYGYPYYSPYDDYDRSPYYGSGYAYPQGYQPNVTVVYPPGQSSEIAYEQRANPIVRNYDQQGQEIGPSGNAANAGAGSGTNARSGAASNAGTTGAANASPVYLIAFKDGVIRAAESYSVSGNALRYVTLQNEQKQAPLDTVDRSLSQRLNRERRVEFSIP